MAKTPVVLLGATGMVGQRMAPLSQNHSIRTSQQVRSGVWFRRCGHTVVSQTDSEAPHPSGAHRGVVLIDHSPYSTEHTRFERQRAASEAN